MYVMFMLDVQERIDDAPTPSDLKMKKKMQKTIFPSDGHVAHLAISMFCNATNMPEIHGVLK